MGSLRLRVAPGTVPSAGLLFIYDIAATALSIVLSLVLRFDTLDLSEAVLPYLPVALAPLLVRPPVRIAFGLYHREWRFASMREMRDIVTAVVVGSVLVFAVFGVATVLNVPGTSPFPRSFFLIEPLITLGLVGGARFALRMGLERAPARRPRKMLTPTLIYGAGEAGAGIARSSMGDIQMGIGVVGFVDDDRRKHGSRLLGQRVYGSLDDLDHIVERTGARQLLIAMPSRSGEPLRRAVTAGQELGLDVKIIPAIRDLITGEIQMDRPRQISVDDLLRREPVQIDNEAIANYLNGASVLVTGGGGSIGGELARQILRLGPRVLTVVDQNEAGLWNFERDAGAILERGSGVRVNPVLADVRSHTAVFGVMERARPDVVFHAAALKHVPYVELHPSEGVLTNVLGTRNVLEACQLAKVPRFVLISTDKAVEPTSMMGWTKRLAELLTSQASHSTSLPYSAVRFGNVLGSSGSLVPLVERQLNDGVPVTITEPDATRYFMTLAEAVTLILGAGAAATPGGLYVLDMGAPVRIGDLVRDLVRLHGMEEDDVSMTITGLRPGEKLHESLHFPFEQLEETGHPGIRRAKVPRLNGTGELDRLVADLEDAAHAHDDQIVRRLLRSLGGLAINGSVPVPEVREDEIRVTGRAEAGA
jgi:FlaA1/EpsC-like NDP-sugar epimerase